MKVHCLAGDPRSIGRRLGELAHDALREVLPRIGRFREVTEQWAGTGHLAALADAGRTHQPNAMLELEGMAEGADMPFDVVFAWNCRGDFPGGGDQTALAGCTDVMIQREVNGQAVMAHNEDDQPELDGHCCLVHVVPEDGPAFMSFYSPGLLPGHTFGWNAAGLVQTINHLRTHDQRVGVPRHLTCRAVLGCAGVDAAASLIRGTARAGGFHHNLGSAGAPARLMSLEAPASGIVMTPVNGAHVHANHVVEPPFRTLDQTITDSSRERHQRAGVLAAGLPADPEAARAVLADDHVPNWPIRRRVAGGADTGHTLAAAVFTLRSGHVHWAVYGDPARDPVLVGEDLLVHDHSTA